MMKKANHKTAWSRIPYLAALLTLLMLTTHTVMAQQSNTTLSLTRYVATTGSYVNTGLSWKAPKANIQDAINDLRSYMLANGIEEGGKVYVAAGTYTPTESTEESGGTTLNLSFKMYAGITVYGGFNPDAPEDSYDKRKMVTYDGKDAGTYGSQKTGAAVKMKYETELSGNLNQNRACSMIWDDTRQRYTATFPGSTYHVVTFATAGWNGNGRAKALTHTSGVNGCLIRYGNANNNDVENRYNTAYGGGVYAVDGASVEYCEISHCSASRDGGGVYCDGGGKVTHCYIHTCQALGIGITYGEGGGVMMDGKGSVTYSYLTNNYAHEGGAITLEDSEDLGRNNNFQYQTSVTCCLLANNTSSSEAGGLYMKRGGVVMNSSIYRNRCNGTGVVVGGVPNGQAANVYTGEASRIYNSVIWGGTIGTADDNKDDIQYASSAGSSDERPLLSYVAVSKHDEADWTYTRKNNVFSIAEQNTKQQGEENLRYLALKNPSEKAGILSDVKNDEYLVKYDWQPYFFSSVAVAGVQFNNLPTETGLKVPVEHLTSDLMGESFTPTVTLGARTAEVEIATATKGVAYMEDPTFDPQKVYTLFVDPERSSDLSATGEYRRVGISWDLPLNNIRVALAFFQQLSQGTSGLQDADGNALPAWNPTEYRYQILVKEGTCTPTINTGSDILRAASIWMDNDVALYGSFDGALTGTATNSRNPMTHTTEISGEVMNAGFAYNSAHLVQFGNVNNAILDGFRLTLANAGSQNGYEADGKGAGIRVRNDRTMYDNGQGFGVHDIPASDRKAMNNNIVRNCLISNCGASDGAAIYMESVSADQKATLKLENVIIHNNGTNYNAKGNIAQNASYSILNTTVAGSHSAVYVGKNARLEMNHCDVLRNVAYGVYVAEGGEANIRNTILYANFDKEIEETNEWDKQTGSNKPQLMQPIVKKEGATLSGKNNKMDAGTDETGKSIGDAVLTYSFVATSDTYPRFANPTRNCGITQSGGDITYYGQATDFTPGNMSPAVNAATYEGPHSTWGTDIVGNTRDYGGIPDVGAVENGSFADTEATEGYNQPAYGKVIYVRDYNTYDENGKLLTVDNSPENPDGSARDGSSWAHAINGNGKYQPTIKQSKLVTSTIEDPYIYRLGVCSQDQKNGTNGEVYFAVYDKTNSVFNSKKNVPAGADEFLLMEAGTDADGHPLYYIYDHTQSQYCYYTALTSGSNGTVKLQASNEGDTKWYLMQHENTGRYIIIPEGAGYKQDAVSWNFYKRFNKTLGLYPGYTDDNGRWGLFHDGAAYPVTKDNNAWEPADENKTGEEFSVKSISYAKTGDLKASTIENPIAYKLSVTRATQSDGRNNVLATTWDNYLRRSGVDNVQDGDDFIFIKVNEDATDNLYYIYSMTKGMYCYYTSTSEGKKLVKMQKEQEGKTTWHIRRSGDKLIIIPGELTDAESSPSWNYHGGYDQYLGLYRGTDTNSKWDLLAPTDNIEAAYLQEAVDEAWERMEPKTTESIETETRWYGGSVSKDVKLTYKKLNNKANEVQVWVGAGIYTRKEGYTIRDHVKVFGAFPRTGNPCKSDRHPQLTPVVTKSAENADVNVADYETILQPREALQTTVTVRVLTHPAECQPTENPASDTPHDHRVYEGAEWDGFTLRYGTTGSVGGRNGGGGASLFENVVLRNCIIRNNALYYGNNYKGRGGGLYCDGGIVENCYVLDNLCNNKTGENYGGGVYMISGTMFNTVIAGNMIKISDSNTTKNYGSGIFLESAKFYNNTLVNNTTKADTKDLDGASVAIWRASAKSSELTMYNTIVIASKGESILWRATPSSTPANFTNCFFQSDKKPATSGSYMFTEGNGKNTTFKDCQIFLGTDKETVCPFVKSYEEACKDYDFRIEQKDVYNCVNAGTSDLGENVTLPDVDMDYTDRVQDCTVDIGAYEYNGAYSITPDVESQLGAAVYYVTQNGFGTSSAKNPANAACWQKLQKVLDAAGRYKFLNPDAKVIVKLAAFPTASEDDILGYTPLRSTEPTEIDLRQNSIMVPRGVEVWGGYPNYVSADDATAFTEGVRDITGNKTYFLAEYLIENSVSTAYHVVTFTDYVFDADGNPYTNNDKSKIENLENSTYDGMTPFANASLLTLGEQGVTDRAVVDGIFIRGGKAETAGRSGYGINYKQYGGAAIVTDYGHIRNCILENNTASEGGGALYLQAGAVVSGTLMKNNSAKYGGAIYVEQVDDNVAAEQLPEEMAQVLTCTVVSNEATTAGGGIWFYNNTRVNSSVFWHNTCADQANVSGQTSARYEGTTQTFRKYPFAYSAVEKIRMPGTNNLNVGSKNEEGVRFTERVFYTLDEYSVLCNVGMPNEMYHTYASNYGASAEDFTFVSRVTEESSSFIDIGARANNSTGIATPTRPEQLLLRLYVSQPSDVNFEMVQKMRESGDATYSKIGSSFAYPMQHLEDALSYIRNARKSNNIVPGTDKPLKYYAANLPFEIIMSKGTFYPTVDIYGNHGYSIANTFLIPEGVTIIGGESCDSISDAFKQAFDTLYGSKSQDEAKKWYEDDGRLQYLGQQYRAKAGTETYTYIPKENLVGLQLTTVLSEDNSGTEGGHGQLVKPRRTPVYENGSGMKGVTMVPSPLEMIKQHRRRADINANSIYEPWEFQNQTILSGYVINTNEDVSNVYHVVTMIADENYVGKLPMTEKNYDDSSIGKKALYPGTINPNHSSVTGTSSHEMGQPIEMDGIEIQGGEAIDYIAEHVQGFQVYNYYHGGGIMVDGNWCSLENANTGEVSTVYRHQNIQQSVAYRDIPLFLENCNFSNNKGGYGAAISSNGTVNIFSSSFTQNQAISGEDQVKYTSEETGQESTFNVQYPGNGGAIYSTKYCNLTNSLFANNESSDPTGKGALATFKTLRNANQGNTPSALYGGAGGCVYGDKNSVIYAFNCDFVRNKATLFPAIYTLNANTIDPANPNKSLQSIQRSNYNQIMNTIFWGNEATVKTNFADLVINYAKKDATHSYSTSTTTPGYPNVLPTSQEDLNKNFAPTLWFCSYEQGTARDPLHDYDVRDCEFDFNTQEFISNRLMNYVKKTYNLSDSEVKEQNSNILLSANNTDLNGPNFVSPSNNAGVDGYLASSDWAIGRLNNIVDNGWGKLKQTITSKVDANKQITYTATFDKNANGDCEGSGLYYYLHYQLDDLMDNDYKPIKERTKLGEDMLWDIYMRYASSSNRYMFRVSHDPNPTHDRTYIDMGVYEYVHTELKPTTENEVDILWISTDENVANGEPDGSRWEQPTSDLQRAIETLLTSRNGHAKEIRITNGEYSPIYTMGDEKLLTFYINTKKLNTQSEITEAVKDDVSKQMVKSLTICGGWAKDWKMSDRSECDTEQYPAIIKSVRQSGVSDDKMNNVFRIEDARQWYGVKTTSQESTLAPNENDKGAPATVIPITIDGLTLVNSNATPPTDPNTSVGAALYYGDQMYYTDSNNKTVDKSDGVSTTAKPCQAPATGEPRLKVNRCLVTTSGYNNANATDAERLQMAATFIGEGGGDALVYNTLFHSNYGDPANATNTKFVNCTFALNRGVLRITDQDESSNGLTSDGSQTGDSPMLAPGKHKAKHIAGTHSMVHNSVFWRNGIGTATAQDLAVTEAKDGTKGYTDQFLYKAADATAYENPLKGKGNGTSAKFTYNAVTEPSYYDDNNLKDLTYSEDEQHNIGLALENSDAVYGPNFNKVELTALSAEELQKRDFHLLPSVRLMNTGSNDIYEATVGTNPTEEYRKIVTFSGTDATGNPATVETITTYTSYDSKGQNPTKRTETKSSPWNVNISDGIFDGFESDLSAQKRVRAVTIDRGAYEFQNALSRVIYVDPSHTEGDGTSWDQPYASLQKAIDLVAVYHNAYAQQAYVFAKEGRCNESIILRDGVSVYGSIPKSYNKESDRNITIVKEPKRQSAADDPIDYNKAWTEDNGKLQAYERDLTDGRNGLAFHSLDNPQRTIINGVENANATYTGYALLDGMDIHGSSSEGQTDVIYPVVDISTCNGTFALRNCIIRDNIMTGTDNEQKPIVDIANGVQVLLYNILMQNNKGGSQSAVVSLGDKAYAVNVTNVTPNGNTVTGKGTMIGCLNWASSTGKTGVTLTNANNIKSCNADADGYPFTDYIQTNKEAYGDYPYIRFQLDENSIHIDTVQVSDYNGMPEALKSFISYDTDRDLLGNPRLINTADGKIADGTDKVDRGCFETWRVGAQYLEPSPDKAKATTTVATVKSITSQVTLAADGTKDYVSQYALYPQEGSVVYIMPGSNLVLGELSLTSNNDKVVDNPLYRVGDKGYIFAPAYLLVKDGGSLYGQGCEVRLRDVATERYYFNGRSNDTKLSYNHLTALPYDFDMQDTRLVLYNNEATANKGTQGTALHNTGAGRVTTDNLYYYNVQDRAAWDYSFQTTNSSLWTKFSSTTSTELKAGQGILLAPSFNGGEGALLRFEKQGNGISDYVYTERADQWYKTATLSQNDETESKDGKATFTDAENMGWNCIGLPYLQGKYLTGERSTTAHSYYAATSHMQPNNEDGENTAEHKAQRTFDYQLHAPHTLWLYYNDTDQWKSVNSWEQDPQQQEPYLMTGEAFFAQTASVQDEETLTFSLPLWLETTTTPNPAPSLRHIPGTRTGGKQIEDNLKPVYRVYSTKGLIHIEGLTGTEHVTVHDAAGVSYMNVQGAQGHLTKNVYQGVYIVCIDGETHKLTVR